MSTVMEEYFVNRIVSGLQRRSITTCSAWARRYRVLGFPYPGPFNFKYHPWELALHDSEAPFNVGQKAAQMGFTDTLLNLCFYNIDIKGKDVLYVLPATTPHAHDFTASRFNPAIESSTHLASLFSDVQNIGHKRAGTRNLFIRGSRSRAGLKSIPVGFVALDEVDEMNQRNIPLVFERLSGQPSKSVWMISTPTVPAVGINEYFSLSTQNHYFFPCPSCSRHIEFTFPDNIIITAEDVNDPSINDSYYICNLCHSRIDQPTKHIYLNKGEWVQQFPGRDSIGWHISQLYSSTISPIELAKSYLTSHLNKADEQEFYNSKLGLTHEVPGSRITDQMISDCIKDYVKPTSRPNMFITMGVDQGKYIHYEIDGWIFTNDGSDLHTSTIAKLLDEGKVLSFEELDTLMHQWLINFTVIDSQPERRKANEFANRFRGRVRLCWYPEGMNTRQISLNDTDEESSINVDRTSWLDTALGRFYNQTILLPKDVSFDYREQIKAPTRTYKKDKNGNPISRYVTGSNRADHFAHARNYSEIALHVGVSLLPNRNISSI